MGIAVDYYDRTVRGRAGIPRVTRHHPIRYRYGICDINGISVWDMGCRYGIWDVLQGTTLVIPWQTGDAEAEAAVWGEAGNRDAPPFGDHPNLKISFRAGKVGIACIFPLAE